MRRCTITHLGIGFGQSTGTVDAGTRKQKVAKPCADAKTCNPAEVSVLPLAETPLSRIQLQPTTYARMRVLSAVQRFSPLLDASTRTIRDRSGPGTWPGIMTMRGCKQKRTCPEPCGSGHVRQTQALGANATFKPLLDSGS